MHAQLIPLYNVLQLNTKLFLNCLDGVNDEMAQQRISGETNNVAFIAVHLADVRFYLAKALGVAVDNPFKALAEVRSIDQIETYPTLEDIRAGWVQGSTLLESAFADLTEDQLRAPAAQRFPISDESVLGTITFLAQHESYHIGQLAFLRKYLGLGRMRYA